MNIIVTGANGFIGSFLIKELISQKECYITALIRKGSNRSTLPINRNINIVEVDYTKDEPKELFNNHDICIHLIGKMGEYGVLEEEYKNVNVELTMRVLEWSEQAGIKQFIFCSTPGVQGFGHRLAIEEDLYAPRNFYEKTKAEAEERLISFCQSSRIKYTIIRPDFVYGPGDKRRVKMYKNIKERKFVLTTSGKSYLHPTYISDVVQGFIISLNNVQAYNQIFNISAGQDITVLNYLQTIAEYTGSKLLHFNIGYRISIIIAIMIERICDLVLKRDSFVSKNKIDFLAIDHSTSNKKAKKMIGFVPEYDIEKGMKKTIEWCKKEKLL